MDIAWVTLALNDLIWIVVAFVFGLLSKKIGLPPMVGFLVAGFFLNSQISIDEHLLTKMADLGITLLLFTVGLKIQLKNILQPQIWAVALLHTSSFMILMAPALYFSSFLGGTLLLGVNFATACMLAFAFSFSSTVFVVKSLEEKGEIDSLHGRIAVGILIIQDILAVIFLAASSGKYPSIWSLALLLLIPARIVLYKIFDFVGRGELLVLYGFILALGGAEIFELVEIKGDLGALVFGVMIAHHKKSEELSKVMLGFKDLFLLGFFLSIGLSGVPNLETVIIAGVFTVIIVLKALGFFALLLSFNLRSRTSLLATINLGNFSEFGLIVIAIAVANHWVDQQWLIVMALSISFSFIIAALLSDQANNIYLKFRSNFLNLQKENRVSYDQLVDLGQATVAIIGMGTIGTGAYDQMVKVFKSNVIGIDINETTAQNQCHENRHVIVGDPSDADFWDRINQTNKLKLILLTLPNFNTTLTVIEMLKQTGYKGKIAATAKFEDEMKFLLKAGADTVFNMHTEAGIGFASHVLSSDHLPQSPQ